MYQCLTHHGISKPIDLFTYNLSSMSFLQCKHPLRTDVTITWI